MADLDFPTIGDILLSPHTKVLDPQGNYKYDLLECDGSTVDSEVYPELYIKSLGYQAYPSTYTEVFDLSDVASSGGDITELNGYFYVAKYNGTAGIIKYDSDFASLGQITDVSLPQSMCNDGEYLWVGRTGGNRQQLSTDGSFTSVSFNTSNETTSAYAMCYDEDRECFWCPNTSGEFFKYTTDGYTGDSFTSLSNVYGMDFYNGYIYAVNTSGVVYKIDPSDGSSEFIMDVSEYLNDPSGITLDDEGNIYLQDGSGGSPAGAVYYLKSNRTLPSLTSPSTTIPYKIVADLTE